jgi:hypothetical protein
MKPTLPEALPKVAAYKLLGGNGCGGSLHIVLGDGNIEDSHVSFCERWARDNSDPAGVELAALLLRMSKTQRREIYKRFHAMPYPSDADSIAWAVKTGRLIPHP